VTDKLDPERRSALMARVRQENTKPELVTRRLLHSMGFRFRLHDRRLPGTPDIVLKRHRKIVFVHGCFWHGHEGCRRSELPETRHDWWAAKIAGNRQRDDAVAGDLQGLGWDVLVVWECETRDGEVLSQRLRSFMQSGTAGT